MQQQGMDNVQELQTNKTVIRHQVYWLTLTALLLLPHQRKDQHLTELGPSSYEEFRYRVECKGLHFSGQAVSKGELKR